MKTSWSWIIVLMAAALLLSAFSVPALLNLQEGNLVPPQTTRTPGAQATQNAEQRNTNGAGKQHGKHENYKGVVVSVDDTGITIELKDGSFLTIALTSETHIRIAGKKDASAGELAAGMQVMVQAIRAEDDTLTARALVYIPGKPGKAHHVGIVTAYSPGESITIQAKDEQFYTYSIDAETKILPAGREEMLLAGAQVTIIAPRNVSDQTQTAAAIVVHPAANPE